MSVMTWRRCPCNFIFLISFPPTAGVSHNMIITAMKLETIESDGMTEEKHFYLFFEEGRGGHGKI